VHVSVSEGRVLLTGAVVKDETKEEAAQLAWKASGVREVINELQVGSNGITDYARDSWISTSIRSRLLVEKNVRSVNYNIEAVNGVVYLLGIAQDKTELDKVTYIASTTKYVKQVVSHVIMRDDPRRGAYARQHNNPSVAPPGSAPTQTPGGEQDGYAPGSNGQPETNGQPESNGQPETNAHHADSGQ
jgi:hypothetical protein